MNIVLGSAFLLLTGIFYILVSGEKGNRKQKGARWIQRWGRKHGWQLPEWMTEECIWQTELAVLVAGVLLIAAGVTEPGRERSGDFTVKTAGIWSGDTGRKSRSRMER